MIKKFIRTMRKISGLSQEELAKKCNVSASTISGYETGYREPNFEILNKIANICDYEINFTNKKNGSNLNVKNISRKEI